MEEYRTSLAAHLLLHAPHLEDVLGWEQVLVLLWGEADIITDALPLKITHIYSP